MRGYDYDRGYRGDGSGGGRRRAPGNRGYDAVFSDPEPLPGWFPGAFMAGAPMYGWGWWGGAWGWPPYGMVDDYDPQQRFHERPPVDPRESPFYGRAADRSVRQWARRYGYDLDIAIRPRATGGAENAGGRRRRR